MEIPKLEQENKFVLFCVLGAFFLSLILGGLARNSLGTILIRAVVSSLVFGGMIYLVIFVLRRYVPGIVPAQGGGAVAGGGSPRHGVEQNVGENAGQESPLAAESVAGVGKPAERRVDLSVTDDGGHPTLPGALTGGGGAEGRAATGDGAPASGTSGDGSTGGEDTLPDIDEIYEEARRNELPDVDTMKSDGKADAKKRPGFIQVRNTQIPYDPETMARAIKKVMKQDE